jgi:hypothetical protein
MSAPLDTRARGEAGAGAPPAGSPFRRFTKAVERLASRLDPQQEGLLVERTLPVKPRPAAGRDDPVPTGRAGSGG